MLYRAPVSRARILATVDDDVASLSSHKSTRSVPVRATGLGSYLQRYREASEIIKHCSKALRRVGLSEYGIQYASCAAVDPSLGNDRHQIKGRIYRKINCTSP